MGSVSDSVVRHAHCPVTIVGSKSERTFLENAGYLLTWENTSSTHSGE